MLEIIAKKIAVFVQQHGGETYYVGGYVRDKILGVSVDDIDLEVFGISDDTLANILKTIGRFQKVGKHFPVYRMNDYPIDIALARKESRIGKKHQDFKIEINLNISTNEAAKRRDFTMNAILENVITGEIIDHFNGILHLKQGMIQHVDAITFQEDGLRVLRAAQFATRLKMTVHEKTIALCSKMDVTFLSQARVFTELSKALLQSKTPSVFFEVLRKMHQLLPWFKEINDLISEDWTQTMQVLDEVAKYQHVVKKPLVLMLAALCQSFNANPGVVISLLQRITAEKKLIQSVQNLVVLSKLPIQYAKVSANIETTNNMFDLTQDTLAFVYLSIAMNKNHITLQEEKFLFERRNAYEALMKMPMVQGKDLIARGIKASPHFKTYLSYGKKLHLKGIKKEKALEAILALAHQENC